MQWVYEKITEYTGVTNQDDLAAIMDVMADHCRTFNGLSGRDFQRLARESAGMVAYLKTPHGQECWNALCVSYGINP